MEPFLGMLNAFGFNFPPRSWALCEAQRLPIAQNTALFSLLGTIYGGDGRVDFRLPDLRGRGAVSFGPLDTGGFNFIQGQRFGERETALNVLQMPTHSHGADFTPSGGGGPVEFRASKTPANKEVATAGDYIASDSPIGGLARFVSMADAGVTAAIGGAGGGGDGGGSVQLGNTGQGEVFSIMQPSLAVNWSIALAGVYPSHG